MTTMLVLLAVGAPSIKALVIGLLLICLGILAVAGIIWLIETYILKDSIPNPIKLILAIVILILVVLWICSVLGIL